MAIKFRFVVVCGDGEYIIYTALAWRNKSFGNALDFVWALDSNEYAIRESSSKVRLFKSFKEKNVAIRFSFSSEGIYGGTLLGIRSSGFLTFFDWETGSCVRRIDVVAKNVLGFIIINRCFGQNLVWLLLHVKILFTF